MDADLIYAKTAAGEKAMQERTRVVQRNIRMVLILVDGNATVAELCNRTGNAQLTQNALFVLESDGFIERKAERDPLWGRRDKPGRHVKADDHRLASEFSTFGNRDESALVQSWPSDSGVPGTLRPTPEHARQSSLSPSSLPQVPSRSGPHSGPHSGTIPRSDDELAALLAASTEKAPSRLTRLMARMRSGTATDLPDLKAIRSGGRGWHLAWPLTVMLGVLALAVLLVLVAMLFPYARYLPEVEAALALRTGQPANVDDMRVSFYPRPGLLLGTVRLGETGEIRIAELRLQPVFGTLLSSNIRFREINLSGIELSAAAIGSLSRMLASAVRESASSGELRVTVDKADVSFAGLGSGDMRGELGLSPHDGLLQSVSLHSADRSLQLEAQPIDDGLAVQIEGLGWRPSPKSPYLFDSLTLKGEIRGTAFTIDHLEMRIFGGLAEGAAVLRADRQRSMSGEISFERISAQRFGEALGIGGQFEGNAAGKVKFAATSDTWSDILSALYADGEMTMTRGSLGGIDLPEAVRRVSATPATLGGATRFEQLSGALRLTPTSYRLSRLVLNAGLMQSTGQLELSHDLQLRGRMDVQMRGYADHSAKQVAISGPLKSPQLQTPPP